MIRFLLSLICLLPAFAAAQVRHEGRMQDRTLLGTHEWFDAGNQKIAEVNYDEEGDLIGFKTWDAKGLLIDDEHADPKRKRAALPQNLELTYLENGLGYLIVHGRAEESAPAARNGERVAVHYELLLQDLTLVQETYTRNKPLKFKFGEGEVIPGFEQAVSMLKVGEEGYFHVPAELGYGGTVVGGIPPFSALTYRIKFVDLN